VALKAAGAGSLTVSASPALLPLFERVAGVDNRRSMRPGSNQPDAPLSLRVAVPMTSAPWLSP